MSVLHCCQCTTKFTERYVYGSLYLDRDDPRGSFSPQSPGPGFRWTYSAGDPQSSYTIFELKKVMRYLYKDPTSTTKCDCTNASGGKPLEDEQYLDSTPEDLGLITKRFAGYWQRPGNASKYWGNHSIQYIKTLQWDDSSARYQNDHWCGTKGRCPGAPWPKDRGYDKRNEFRRECYRIQS